MHVILVIDGMALPSEKAINEGRRQDRAAAFMKGLAAEKMSNARDSRNFFSRACSITLEMKHKNLTLKCHKMDYYPFLVAFYELDVQLARLSHTGMVDLIISEDSDMLVYGCARVLFKLDPTDHEGPCHELLARLSKLES
jgi:exonuclease-1